MQQNTAEFRDFEALLDYIDTLAKTGDRMIIAIDEYPYLAASYPSISSMLQSHIDNCWKDSKLFFILCGSSMSFIEEQAILYGACGGIPEYLSRVSTKLSVHENLTQLFFEESGRLFEEPVNLMKQELKDPMSYHSIISAIASGASKVNEIATKTGLETSGCSNQLSSLISLGIVCKETPITEPETSRKTLYRLADSMYVLWYRFVRPNISSISRGVGEQIYKAVVLPQLNDFMGKVFEEICQQYLFLPGVYETLPFPVGKVGHWWGNNPQKKCQEEIDLMSVYEDKLLIRECKWKNEKVGMNVMEYAKENENIRLVDFEKMCEESN